MPLLIDYTEDRLYKQGKVDAITELQENAIRYFLKQKKLTLQEIADAFSIPVETVKEIQERLKQK